MSMYGILTHLRGFRKKVILKGALMSSTVALIEYNVAAVTMNTITTHNH